MAGKLSYWERRAAQNMHGYMQDAEDTADKTAKIYRASSGYISAQADDIFEKYRTKHHLSRQEAMQLINTLHNKASISELQEKLRSDKGDKNKQELLAALEAPAYQSRIDRLQQLQNQLDLVMSSVYRQEKAFHTSHYVDLANEAYYRGIYDIQQKTGLGFSFDFIDPRMIDHVMNSKWLGKNYSARIWKNTRALAQDLKEELLINLITGRTNREVAEIIDNKFAAGASASRRLVRTESNYLATELNFKAYEEAGIERYCYCAILDLKTSRLCRSLDRKIYPVSERRPGTNCPPMHPWCRSTTIPVITEELLNKLSRKARDPATGNVIEVPMGMDYQDWYDKYVKGKPEAELAEKQIRNRSADRKQYQEYKKVLGENVPDSLDDFQKIKYNEEEYWKYTKLAYQRQRKLLEHPELKLPNADNAVLPEGKFTKYLFGGDKPSGLAKGRAFISRLGYDLNNWEQLQAEIAKGALKYPAYYKDHIEFGDRYEQKMILNGKEGTPANVVVGWILKQDGSVNMTSTYIKEVK